MSYISHLYSIYFAPRGNIRMAELGMQIMRIASRRGYERIFFKFFSPPPFFGLYFPRKCGII